MRGTVVALLTMAGVLIALGDSARVEAQRVPCGGGGGNYDIGPADPGTMKACYDYTTGEFTVSVDGLNNWLIAGSGMISFQESGLRLRPEELPLSILLARS